MQRVIDTGRKTRFGFVIAAGAATLIRAVLATNIGILVGRPGADIVEIAGAAATGRSVIATDERRARIVVARVVWRCYRTGELAIRAERAIAAIEAEAAAADLIVTTGGVVSRRHALSGIRVAGLTFGATRLRACINALTGIRILMLALGAGDRIADAPTAAVAEALPARTLIVDAALLAADLVRAAGRAILLPKARIAGAGIRIALLAFFTGIIAGSLAAACIVASATLLTDRATVARFFLGRFVGVGPTTRDRSVIEIGIRAAGVAHVAIDNALTGVRLRTSGSHIRQKRLIAVALDVVACVVADVMVIARWGEIDVSVGANLVRNEVTNESIRRAATVEFRHMTGVRHTIGAKSEIGDRVERLQAGWLATLKARHIRNAVT